ncbi:MAG: hypothetical protein HYT46_01590 [Candidatus Vogelbacteria bacterium]|nr:hypothetical protein [Candidatus Vogelbacteria bacterium]
MKSVVDVVGEIRKSQSANFHRGKSWEYCYAFFRNHEKFSDNEKLLDFAALHLGFFLASWGMFRGSSFLLQKDYKFYISIVEILTDSEYNRLWDIDFLNKSKEQNQDVDLLFRLKEELENKIIENNTKDKDGGHEMNLIITKIIMATMGCVPGYDKYFKGGLKNWLNEKEKFQKEEIRRYLNFKKDSFKNLLNLVNENNKLKNICDSKQYLKKTRVEYPPMKLLDLFFWLIGREMVISKVSP